MRRGTDIECLDRWKIETLKTGVEKLAIQINTALEHLVVGLAEIGKKAFAKTCFQNSNTALNLKSFFLSDLARPKVVENNKICTNLLANIMVLSSPTPKPKRS
jgi:hypothetical protein